MSSAETIKKIQGLPFETDDVKAAVIGASVKTDFGSVVEALFDIDKELLVKTLAQQATDGGNKRREKELGDFKDMALKSVDRESWLAAQKERPQQLEPCTLSDDEKAALIAKNKPIVFAALAKAQEDLVHIGKQRDELEADSKEDRALEEKMEVVFETMDTAKKLAAMLDAPEGAVYSEAFWSAIQAEDDVLQNKALNDLSDVWVTEDAPEEDAAKVEGGQ
eukprot:TRINITY_DN25687_c0_g1_i1.p1 TRINITY_DN25687_c0_g1~~TRINITY_DN25687_c0_g1_i1.p1  ORF type:complete len:221 (+),score=118.61 TRINITY_DN25687_c0_g1_i1:71-733(+)